MSDTPAASYEVGFHPLVVWAYRRFRPAEGWLPVALLLAAVTCLSASVAAVEWSPEAGLVGWAATVGLLLGTVLAGRPIRAATAWLLLLDYGLVLSAVYLGRLRPPLAVLSAGWDASAAYLRQNAALLADRAAGWARAVSGGGSSQETVVFSAGLGLLVWFLAAYAGWSAFRQRRPLAGLTAVGLALAFNTYFGDAPIWPAAVFIGLAALLAAALHYANMEHEWQARQVDYSQEIRLDLLLTGGGIALILLLLAFLLPSFSLRRLSRAVFDRPAVRQAEDTLERVFAGVQPPRRGPLDEGAGLGASGRGLLPRTYLLGNPPELSETLVMRAVVFYGAAAGGSAPPTHWRGLSYDVYTGRGWAVSTERQEEAAAGQSVPLPPAQATIVARQQVEWLMDRRTLRYTLGLPLGFGEEVELYWRGLEDLSRVHGAGPVYVATSRVSVALPEALRGATPGNVPPAVLARYTQLPENVPGRVRELAQTVAGDRAVAPTPYDQARALEAFLRQYPYSLDVPLPPADRDPVEYFLFELQAGYCDYYASAMVILARSLGLPARLAAGFLPQPADDAGRQSVYLIHGHSWPEIYFAGYGWIEFEPTAGFPAVSDLGAAPVVAEGGETAVAGPTPPPIPRPLARPALAWWPALLLVALLAGWWLWWRRQTMPAAPADTILWAYGRLQRFARGLGQATPASQTPAEFRAALLARLEQPDGARPWLAGRINHLRAQVRPEIERLVGLFMARQYGWRRPDARLADASWQQLRGRLWLLRWLNRALKG